MPCAIDLPCAHHMLSLVHTIAAHYANPMSIHYSTFHM
jgi:hypothetical protein